ncbi:uncharacterized protein LOC126372767 [Pectinophora gossypiella]|nr:uncharacterized protein LOC126372767 [Pectinophora gossypiella]XP_049874601.1 uncharacterized protein LOC126372767 [Pectinophora gossypiella]XP_049874602.1 uncharacterized protein LOC126372767 [Pectinophora gossypiella]
MAEFNANINFLLKDELIHELSIRNVKVDRDNTVEQLRKLFRQTCKQARRGSIVVPSEGFECDLDDEHKTLTSKINEIISCLSSPDKSPSAHQRILGRAQYLLLRLSRIERPADDLEKLKTSLLLSLANNDITSDSSSDSEHELNRPSCINKYKTIISHEKKYNLNSLNLKFKGDSCVRVFLARLEELCSARNILVDDIYTGFTDLVDGPALCWYRANKCRFSNYSELVSALKSDFDLPDYDFRLLEEIRSRTQAKDESIVIYLSIILGMMSRLSKELSESDKLDIILRNIRPEYSREIRMIDVTTIQQLQQIGKRLELSKHRIDNFIEPNFSKNSVAPDFNFKCKPKSSRDFSKNIPVASVIRSSTCFRCGGTNHSTNRCNASKEVVCFKCGKKGVKAPLCPNCNSHSNSKN